VTLDIALSLKIVFQLLAGNILCYKDEDVDVYLHLRCYERKHRNLANYLRAKHNNEEG
jgi:hypothetical protein